MTEPVTPPTDTELLAAILTAWTEEARETGGPGRARDRMRRVWPSLGVALDNAVAATTSEAYNG